MNSKKLLQSLLLSLGVVTLVTACGKTSDSESTQPSVLPSQQESVTPSDDTSEESVKPSEVESSQESVKPSESESEQPSESESEQPSESESEKPTESESEQPSESEEQKPQNEFTSYQVDLNYNDHKTTVWTGFALDGTIGATPTNKSGQDALLEDRYSIDSTVYGQYGYYTFVIDEEGYIAYASYGLGAGWGNPADGYYHNQASKNYADTDYFILHDEYAQWPAKTSDGQNAWTLYDFVIPENGFVITAWHDDATFVSLWKQLFGDNASPVLKNIESSYSNAYLENSVTPRSLDKFYVTLGEDRTVKVAERLESQVKDDSGTQEEETPAITIEDTGAEVATYDDLGTALAAYKADTTSTATYTLKGVVSYVYEDASIVISDNQGNDTLVYNKDRSLLLDSDGNRIYAVGDTVAVTGSFTTYKDLVELVPTSLSKIEKYGKMEKAEVEIVTSETAGFVSVDNQSKVVKLVGAVVKSINASGSSVVTLGDTEITLFKAAFPETVAVGDTVDVIGVISVYSKAQLRVSSADDISRYYNVNIDADGDDSTALVTKGYSKGDVVTLTAQPKENYIFVKWVKVTADGDVDYSKDATTTFEVGEEDATLKAICQFAPWNDLDSTMGNSAILTPSNTDADAGADAIAIWTDSSTVFHQDGDWTTGSGNMSWRTVVAVDATGKIAYMVYCPGAGYGNPADATVVYTHPDYTVTKDETTGVYTTTNPAVNLLEGFNADGKYEVVCPEGGFIITAHGAGANNILSGLLGVSGSVMDYAYNKANSIDSRIRVYYDSANNKIRTYIYSVAEGNKLVDLNVDGYGSTSKIGLFTDDDRNKLECSVEGRHTFATGWRYVIAVNKDGKIVYTSYGLGEGYGSPADTFYADVETAGATHENAGSYFNIFYLGSNFASWAECQTEDYKSCDFGDYVALVPEDGFVIVGAYDDAIFCNLITEIFGAENLDVTTEAFNALVDGTFNNIRVHYVEINGVPQIKVEKLEMEAVTNISLNRGDSSLSVSWDASTLATKYVVTITDAKGSKIVDAQETTDCSVSLDSTLTGVLNVTVVATDGEGTAPATKLLVLDEISVGDTVLLTSEVVKKTYAAGSTIFDGTTWENGEWSNYMIIDADGKIAYLCWNVGCGYGTPAAGTFYCNEAYATTNPCISGSTLVVPEGFTGFSLGYVDATFLALTNNQVSHTMMDADGYSDLVKNFNSKSNSYIRQNAKVTVKDGYLLINYGAIAQVGTSFDVSGSVTVSATWNASTGLYEGQFTLQQWNNVIFTYVDADGNNVKLTPSNTTFSGAILTTTGADWTTNLYLDDGDADAAKGWYCCASGGTVYTFTYNPATSTLTVSV